LPTRALAALERAPATARFGAAWDDDQGHHHIGLLAREGEKLRVVASVEMPTRAHGLAWEPDGRLLATARRPGDWLLRWSPEGTAKPQWQWTEPDRRTTGHTLRDPDGAIIYSVEADVDTAQCVVVARDAASLAVRAEYPTGGIDAHMLVLTAAGDLLVANGGVPTVPEAGRQRGDMDRMASSLVLLRRPRRGRLRGEGAGETLGQWRLADARLSLRHMTRHASGVVGIALQAEHDDASARRAAPVLALFDGQRLRTADLPKSLNGYGGDITLTGDGFAVSTPRANGVARWSAEGRWQGFETLTEACALCADDTGWWAGGVGTAVAHRPAAAQIVGLPTLRLDNHWVLRRA